MYSGCPRYPQRSARRFAGTVRTPAMCTEALSSTSICFDKYHRACTRHVAAMFTMGDRRTPSGPVMAARWCTTALARARKRTGVMKPGRTRPYAGYFGRWPKPRSGRRTLRTWSPAAVSSVLRPMPSRSSSGSSPSSDRLTGEQTQVASRLIPGGTDRSTRIALLMPCVQCAKVLYETCDLSIYLPPHQPTGVYLLSQHFASALPTSSL